MREDTIFHLIFALSFITIAAIRVYYHRKAKTYRDTHGIKREGIALGILRLIAGLTWFAGVVLYIVAPQSMSWADFSFPLPTWLRWLGVGMTLFSVGLTYWINRTLGENFSTTLVIRENHSLITSGPYRYIRHPMYTAFVLMGIGFTLLTAHWWTGPFLLLAIAVIMIVRTPKEEAMLLEHFGDEYRRYMARTGRYLPRWDSLTSSRKPAFD